ncbi:Vacuolar protein sorting-associated protein 9b [Tolypocladium paradoxum]|uniref:Vacuolar protein sorting-associated protein 9b n=1 Tax=Tolypocladium paradoxum TaxID=94208 RepID=A0A2S4L695_9HYPO|nr:Vacuolar protein sorting-associated protein 9b [Tolypocladium paradoxum]
MIVYPPSQRFMASQSSKPSRPARQGATRMPSYPEPAGRDHSDSLKPPKRAHTFHNGSPAERHRDKTTGADGADAPDAFETSETPTDADDNIEITRASVELDDLPIELITLTDSFIESLGAKVHATPPSIDRLSQLFQEFYALASSHIATHISALASRQSRDASPAPSASSMSSAASRLRSKATSLGAKDKPKVEAELQMITAEELAERKRARKALEAKRGLLEEAVERRLCEGIYDRIYRHRSTQDEAHDDKLRSKTAALALVGIGLGDLGVDTGDEPPQTPEAGMDRDKEIREWLGQARTDLTRMGESRYPLGKLNRLKAAHKSIVDTLAHFHPSASADEIMPMLIYTLITLPPECLHVISDLHFIQYFRWEPKLTGEAAYCLTNLEAAISFLQTVDLATLRADEHPEGPPKSSTQPGTPKTETFPPAYPQGLTAASNSASESTTDNASATKPAPSPSGLKAANVLRNRRLSDLVNTPAQAIGAASDAVISTADQGLKTISNSLGDSYSFLLGKLRERQQGPKESIVVPRTLDDARKLVSTPPPDEEDNGSGAGSTVGAEDAEQLKHPPVREDRVVNMIGGRRDASVDSAKGGRSATPSKKVLFAEEPKSSTSFLSPGQSPAVLEQMRNLGNTFNPMARLSNIGMIRGFGRNVSTPTSTSKESGKPADGGDLASAFPDIAAALPPKEVPKIPPPNKRFMELQNPGELRLGEVLDLLRDYRRLAGALKNMGAFEEK